jgi:hypothetical protein
MPALLLAACTAAVGECTQTTYLLTDEADQR